VVQELIEAAHSSGKPLLRTQSIKTVDAAFVIQIHDMSR